MVHSEREIDEKTQHKRPSRFGYKQRGSWWTSRHGYAASVSLDLCAYIVCGVLRLCVGARVVVKQTDPAMTSLSVGRNDFRS